MHSDEGKQMLNTGKFAMVYGGDWFARENRLQSYAPDTSGKWAVTKLPLGIHGKIGGSALLIPSQSKKKDLAWAFVEYATLTAEGQAEQAKILIYPAFKPAWEVPELADHVIPFFGEQNILNVFAEAARNTPVSYMTALDGTANGIWFEGVSKAIDEGQDSRAAIQQIADVVEKAVAVQKAEILANKY